jgi:desulfoferrodoxin (superoxide reductase-like protein)
MRIQQIEADYYVTMRQPMRREHSISFFAYVTTNQVQILKLYPEQSAEARFPIGMDGAIYAYCNRHGLFKVKVRRPAEYKTQNMTKVVTQNAAHFETLLSI